MDGEEGDDTYYVDSPGDQTNESSSAFGGTDTVYASSSYTLGNYLEELILLEGTNAISGTGNSQTNTITGNSADNVLDGGSGGFDTLFGSAGNDTLIGGSESNVLDGGADNDSMRGGAGSDSYYVDSIGDTITEAPDQGSDTVYSSISYILGDNLEGLTLTGNDRINGTGNSGYNTIKGNDNANYLYGGANSDRLLGEGGSDTLDGGLGVDELFGGWVMILTTSIALLIE